MHDFMASGKTLNLVFESDELQFRICSAPAVKWYHVNLFYPLY